MHCFSGLNGQQNNLCAHAFCFDTVLVCVLQAQLYFAEYLETPYSCVWSYKQSAKLNTALPVHGEGTREQS